MDRSDPKQRNPRTTHHEREIFDRRMKMADLRKAGVTGLRPLAEALKISLDTARKDMNWLDGLWREQAVIDIDIAKGLQLERLNLALHNVMPLVAQRVTRESSDRDLQLFMRACDKLLAISEHQCRILGLNAPVKIDLEGEVRAIAAAVGLDPDKAVLDAEAIIRSASHR